MENSTTEMKQTPTAQAVVWALTPELLSIRAPSWNALLGRWNGCTTCVVHENLNGVAVVAVWKA
jgi:hypothetical protein